MAGAIRFAIFRQPILRNSRVKSGNRQISTSNKSKDTVVTEVESGLKHKRITDAAESAEKSKKNWISYGFSTIDEATDRFAYKISFFSTITLGLVLGSFILAYQPDYMMHDWAQREAYLELNRREKLGLPLIDKNLIDPNKFDLPSDEELGDTEIYM